MCYENCYLEKMGIPSFIGILAGENKFDIWTCSNCWTCQAVCPASLPLMELKWNLQQNTAPPPSYAAALKNILQCGYCLPIEPEEINPFRLDEGLEPIRTAQPDMIAAVLQTKPSWPDQSRK